MRLMYLPNESGGTPTLQRSGRAGFGALLERGRLAALDIYSYYERLAALGTGEAFAAEFLARVAAFRPDIIFVQHLPQSGIAPSLWRDLRTASPGTALIYHEADVYGRMMKRVHRNIDIIAAEADLTILCSFGYVYDRIRSRAKSVAYLPHCFDAGSFSTRDPLPGEKRFDAVHIGNCVHSRLLKQLYLPGGGLRADLVRRLSRELGTRFGLFGRGWDGVPSQGTLPFLKQEAVLQSSRISVNWDHFHTYPYYFSDRLPISLAAAVPHVTSHHPGYEQFFAGCPGLYWGRSVPELIDCVRWLLDRPDAQLREEGLAAREWVTKRLEGRVIFEQAFELSLASWKRRSGRHD
jgi:hypothetical protein